MNVTQRIIRFLFNLSERMDRSKNLQGAAMARQRSKLLSVRYSRAFPGKEKTCHDGTIR